MKNNDSGYITVMTAGILIALAGLIIVVSGLAAMTINSAQAQVAADLSAISAATAFTAGIDEDHVCAAAEETARLNLATLKSCQLSGLDVVVAVNVKTSSRVARAGPL